jgi:hypothetical protein
MRNKKQVTAFALLALLILMGAVLASSRSRVQSAQQKTAVVPDHIVYRHLFHHVVALRKKAEEVEKNGGDATQYRTHFKRKAQLSDDQVRILDETAAEYDQQEKLIEAKAKPLVDAYKAQYPDGKVPHGQKPAPPPAELRALSQERDALVLSTRDKLRAALGDKEFNRFDQFVRTQVAPNVQQLPTH